MVRTPKNVNISTPNVVVNSSATSNGTATRTARNRRRRLARKQNLLATASKVNTVNTSGNLLSEIQDMNSGRMTTDPSSDLTFIRSLRGGACTMDSNTEGWYYKYLDPAGSVETARAVGEFSKIPDGLLTFSVDAEIRTVDTLPVPLLAAEIIPAVPGTIPLDGRTWSLTIFSYPMFRTAYIAVANTYDKEISPTIASELAFNLNNLTDYRATIDANDWAPFAETIEAGWFYWIKPLPPTYNLQDPVVGDQRTLTSWRMSYKSLTIEHNTPTLIDQGFWNGGHYALDSSVVQQPSNTTMIISFVHGLTTTSFASNAPTTARFTVTIPNMPQIASLTGPAIINASKDSFYVTVNGNNATTGGTPVSWVVPSNVFVYNPAGVLFAQPTNIISFSTTSGTNEAIVTFTSDLALSVPFTLNFVSASASIPVSTEALSEIFLDVSVDLFENRTANVIEFPAYNPAQIAANNPKMEQFLMKETNGAYVVHKKMRKPVFEVTPAGSFGPIQFTTPDYSTTRNASDGSGILDTIDANFSTASVCIRGISHANVPVVKLYQGWEGVTNVNTPFGQFGHTGLPRNNCVMELVDNLTVRTTGIYPANDNFLGLIAKFAAGALRNILSSEATPALLGNLAQGVINKGIGFANNKLDAVTRRKMAQRVR